MLLCTLKGDKGEGKSIDSTGTGNAGMTAPVQKGRVNARGIRENRYKIHA
jgi:hypothetical protein